MKIAALGRYSSRIACRAGPFGPWLVNTPGLDPDIAQLLRAGMLAVIVEVGEDHHVGVLGQPCDTLDRARDRLLAVHLGIEKAVEQPPDFRPGDRRAGILMRQRRGKIISGHREVDPMSLAQPVAERRNHVQQHFVAIGDDQGAGQRSCAPASASICGVTPSASAAAVRSASYAQR